MNAVLTRVEAIEDTIQVKLMNVEKNPRFIADIFHIISAEGVDIDMISSVVLEDEMRIDFTCEGKDQKKLDQAVIKLKQAHPRMIIFIYKNMGKLIIEGNMKHEIGIASEIFTILGESMIPFSQVTTSEVSMSFVIEKKYLEKAVKKIKGEM